MNSIAPDSIVAPHTVPDEIPLPSCIARQAEGIFVDPAQAGIDKQFARFVERVFAEGLYFAELDYAHFMQLLYEEIPHGANPPPLFLAQGIAVFSEIRRPLYKAVKIAADGSSAEYMFEPVSLEIPDDAGGEPAREATQLTFDELVAHLWQHGIRFGINEKLARQAIGKSETTRLEIARERVPQPGEDARLIEESDSLHRDNSPKRMANGKIDLGQFSNRYPQVVKGASLMRKVPRVFGKPGFKINGDEIPPEAPADFDLAELAGPGTQIENRPNGETIVASMGGFLNLDTQSNQVSITEKIISRDGVSLRTTGNLSLSGDDYEEFGEVQEKRTVEGNNMTFHADVYGAIVSRGGAIHLHQTLSGGKASSPGGSVTIDGRASASVIEAPDGEVRIKHAEGCTIFATRVIIENAVLCQIIGEHVEIANSAGCCLGGKDVAIGTAGARKDVETIVSMFVPDFTELDEQDKELEKQREELAQQLAQQIQQGQAIQQQPELANFLALQGKIKRGEIKLTPAQAESLKCAAANFAPLLQQLKLASESQHKLQTQFDALTQKRETLARQRQSLSENIQCRIDSVNGNTIVRTQPLGPLHHLAGDTLQMQMAALHSAGEPKDRLFNDDTGSFAWRYAGKMIA